MFELAIRGVKDKQTANERVVLEVHADTNLRDYAVIDNTYDRDGCVSNKDRHFYSFRSTNVKAGDLVRLYSKKNPEVNGSDYTTQELDNSGTQHTFYWGFADDYSVWNNDRDKVSLLKIEDFEKEDV